MADYRALFEPDLKAGGYVVSFPDFGYGVTQGETDEEAVEMAQDLLMLTISDHIRKGKPLPRRRAGVAPNIAPCRCLPCRLRKWIFTRRSDPQA